MPPRLDLAKVLAGAFLVPWWRRAALARVLAVPVALIFAYTLLWQEYAAPRLGAVGGWLGAGLYGLLFTLFAVRCHRVVLLTVAVNLWQWIARLDGTQLQWAEKAVWAVLFYPFGRLCRMFPATAVEHPPLPRIRWAWQLTRGNGWRLFVVVAVLPWLFALLLGAVYREGATTVEWLLVCLLFLALLVVEIAAVSLSYKELTR
jgi:hypothetical protein